MKITIPMLPPVCMTCLGMMFVYKKRDRFPSLLELHHSLVADKTFTYAVPVDWFWEQTEPLGTSSSQMKFENFLMLTPIAQVLYAASHAMLQHGGKNRIPVLVLRSGSFDPSL